MTKYIGIIIIYLIAKAYVPHIAKFFIEHWSSSCGRFKSGRGRVYALRPERKKDDDKWVWDLEKDDLVFGVEKAVNEADVKSEDSSKITLGLRQLTAKAAQSFS